jgi:hypothetical protein
MHRFRLEYNVRFIGQVKKRKKIEGISSNWFRELFSSNI